MVPTLIEKARVCRKKQESNRTKFHWQSAAPLRNSFSRPKIKSKKKEPEVEANVSPLHRTSSALSYSIKYFGISFGEIGVLSKRLPIPIVSYMQRNRPGTAQVIQKEVYLSNTEETDNHLIDSYADPRILVTGKKKQMCYDKYNRKNNSNFIKAKERFNHVQELRLSTPIKQASTNAKKNSLLSKPKMFTAKGKHENFFNQSFSEKQIRKAEYYNEPYLQYLAEIKGLNIRKY